MYIIALALLHEFGLRGPVTLNLRLIVCGLLVHDATVPANVTFAPGLTVEGLMPKAT